MRSASEPSTADGSTINRRLIRLGLDVRQTRLHRELHSTRPATIGIANDGPVWLNANALMNQLETRFGLADRLNWISEKAARLVAFQTHRKPQPAIGQI